MTTHLAIIIQVINIIIAIIINNQKKILGIPWSVISAGLVSVVALGEWNWIRVRPRLWKSPGIPSQPR